jgi:hypothetical protein
LACTLFSKAVQYRHYIKQGGNFAIFLGGGGGGAALPS